MSGPIDLDQFEGHTPGPLDVIPHDGEDWIMAGGKLLARVPKGRGADLLMLAAAPALLAEVVSLRAERDAALARLAAVTRERNDAIARKHGFDRRGPHKGGPSPERGFACECEWSSSRHGDTCPEHGARGVPIPHPPEEMEARLAAAEGEAREGPHRTAFEAVAIAEALLRPAGGGGAEGEGDR